MHSLTFCWRSAAAPLGAAAIGTFYATSGLVKGKCRKQCNVTFRQVLDLPMHHYFCSETVVSAFPFPFAPLRVLDRFVLTHTVAFLRLNRFANSNRFPTANRELGRVQKPNSL